MNVPHIMEARYWPAHQRLVVLTFVDDGAAERFDRLAAIAGDREAIIRVATGGAAECDVVFQADDDLADW